MRGYAQLADVPVIALTASPSFFIETQGFHSVLIKPCPSIDLVAAIGRRPIDNALLNLAEKNSSQRVC
jgi:hypothetical protein